MKNSLWWIAVLVMLGSVLGGCQSDTSGSNPVSETSVSKPGGQVAKDTEGKKPLTDPRTMEPSQGTDTGEKKGPEAKTDPGATKPPGKIAERDDFKMKPVESPTGAVKKASDVPVGQYKASIHLEKGIRTIVFGLMEDKSLIWTESVIGVEPEEPQKRFAGVWSVSGSKVTLEIDFDGRKEKLVGTLDGRSLLIGSYDKARYPVKSLEFFKR
ncbi:MAG TPA: hypothetical protein PLH94_13575 [Fimbriimonadaceae bacterium]|nr:hypothetical protein [Fimbriimonadaceae bacterium]